MTDEKLYYFNGVNLDTSDYVTQPVSRKEYLQAVVNDGKRRRDDPQLLSLDQRDRSIHQLRLPGMGVAREYDPQKLDSSGWCLVYPHGLDPQILDALSPLEKLRNAWPRLEVPAGMSGHQFRESHGQNTQWAEPKKGLPYYLLIAGPPGPAPQFLDWEFQHDLDTIHAVGRVSFEHPEQYQVYANKVVEAEKFAKRKRSLALFAPDSDPATDQSNELLVKPLAAAIQAYKPNSLDGKPKSVDPYPIQSLSGAAATKQQLAGLLASNNGIVFTATHGARIFKPGLPLDKQFDVQRKAMGALLMQGWNKTPKGTPLPAELAFSAADLEALDLSGLIIFSFGCFSAGAPRFTRGGDLLQAQPFQLAQTAFVASLAQQVLRRGALAFIGHVDQTFSYSFRISKDIQPDIMHFERAVKQLLDGGRAGEALDDFGGRYLWANDRLTSAKGAYYDYDTNATGAASRLMDAWSLRQDARRWVLIGDPAVKLT